MEPHCCWCCCNADLDDRDRRPWGRRNICGETLGNLSNPHAKDPLRACWRSIVGSEEKPPHTVTERVGYHDSWASQPTRVSVDLSTPVFPSRVEVRLTASLRVAGPCSLSAFSLHLFQVNFHRQQHYLSPFNLIPE